MSYFGIPIRNGLPIGLGSVAPLASGGGSPFSPLSLFAGGAPGAWYDPSDYSTLFQDSAGTTPVTAVEQPVGLMLDKSQGLVLGPQRVVNGDFATGTAWTLGDGSVSISDGALRFLNTPNAVSAVGIGATTAPTAGMGFWAELNIVSLSAGAVRISYAGSVIATFNTAGQKRVFFVGTNTSNTPIVQAIGTTTAVLDDFSIKELPGNHAFQSTSASRPVLSARKNWLLATETLSTQNVTVLAGQMVLSFYGTGTVTLSGASTAGPLVGTGVANRVSLTFTPTAGTLTLTVSGSVTQAQLEYVA